MGAAPPAAKRDRSLGRRDVSAPDRPGRTAERTRGASGDHHVIYTGLDIRQKIIELAATVSIRNVSAQYPVILNFVRYYDSAGTLVREY